MWFCWHFMQLVILQVAQDWWIFEHSLQDGGLSMMIWSSGQEDRHDLLSWERILEREGVVGCWQDWQVSPLSESEQLEQSGTWH